MTSHKFSNKQDSCGIHPTRSGTEGLTPLPVDCPVRIQLKYCVLERFGCLGSALVQCLTIVSRFSHLEILYMDKPVFLFSCTDWLDGLQILIKKKMCNLLFTCLLLYLACFVHTHTTFKWTECLHVLRNKPNLHDFSFGCSPPTVLWSP